MKTIAYLGPEHTNTHLAALKHFGRQCRYLHAPTVEDVFNRVERRKVHFGVVPIENSLEGAVTHTLDRFIDFPGSPAKVQGEIQLPINHYLIFGPKATLRRIRAVYSHPQALAQCRSWLRQHLPHLQTVVETASTADAVDEIISCEPSPRFVLEERAAIGRKELAKKFGLLCVRIPQEGENKTRFLIIGLGQAHRGRYSKTSMLFGVKDRPGALYDALVPFKRNRINLTKIESRPSKRKAWEYLFFIDLAGHISEPSVKRALDALKRSASFVEVLGSYPRSKT